VTGRLPGIRPADGLGSRSVGWPAMAERLDVLIIGAGFGGAATAWWLRQRGVDRIAILEMEATPGAHASGKNAGIARQPLADPANAALTVRGTAFLRNPPAGFSDSSLFFQSGGFVLASTVKDEGLEKIHRVGLSVGAAVLQATRADVLTALPVLDGSPFQSALMCPSDGVADIHGLLMAYLKGADLRCGSEVTEFEISDGRIMKVRTATGEFAPDNVVVAAGAWSAELGKKAGATPFPLVPKRRHLVHTGPLKWASPTWPWAWFQTPEVYFRPESSGLLFSPCDEDPMAPGSPPTDPEARVWLHERLKVAFPKLSKVPVAHSWAELRAFVPDNRMVLGRDPQVSNLLWVTALGGHGMTASHCIGELASALLCGAPLPLDPTLFSPNRFR
jgi:glycine/D-amino acid oxidase-like deaminating enzyme